MKRTALLTAVLLGCPSSDDANGEETVTVSTGTSNTGTSNTATTGNAETGSTSLGDDTSPCDPGSPGCACANGMCLDPLVCLDDICSWPPPDPTTADADSGSTGDAECTGEGDCGPNGLCYQNYCTPAYVSPFEIAVTDWSPVNCSGGSLDGAADLWWSVHIDGNLIGASGWVQGGCPGHWTTSVCIPDATLNEPFVLNLWDEDNTKSELFDQLWFDYGDGVPGPLPEWVILDGFYDGTTNNGGQVSFTLTIPEQDC